MLAALEFQPGTDLSYKRLLLDRERKTEMVKWKNLDVEVGLDLCSNLSFTPLQFCRRGFNMAAVSKAVELGVLAFGANGTVRMKHSYSP